MASYLFVSAQQPIISARIETRSALVVCDELGVLGLPSVGLNARRQVLADQQWQTVQNEVKENQQLLDLSNQILALTREVHAYTAAATNGRVGAPDEAER
jgi:hypothetical protein